MKLAYKETIVDRQAELLEQSNSYAPVGLLEFDSSIGLVWCNEAAASILPEGSNLAPGTPALDVFETAHLQSIETENSRSVVNTASAMPELVYTDYLELEDGQAIERLTFPAPGDSNGRIWRLRDITSMREYFSTSSMSASFLEDQASEHIAMSEKLHSANLELAAAKNELEVLASTDQLTGLPNRRSFFMEGDAYTDFGDNPQQIVMLMVDIDHFKTVNDTWGHACGDEAIRLLANVIKDELRPSDIVARMGGEEYAAIIKDCDIDKAVELAENIRRTIEATPLAWEDGIIVRMTASLGLAQMTISTRHSVEEALDLADKALYHAKENGRNQVSVHED